MENEKELIRCHLSSQHSVYETDVLPTELGLGENRLTEGVKEEKGKKRKKGKKKGKEGRKEAKNFFHHAPAWYPTQTSIQNIFCAVSDSVWNIR